MRHIPTNKKYKGDAFLQKSHTVDLLIEKKKANKGEVPQFHAEGNHEVTIQSEVFEMVYSKENVRFTFKD